MRTNSDNNPVTAAIIVTFNPDLDTLHKSLCSLKLQVEFIIIVDNSSQSRISFDCITRENTILVRLESNVGLAAAQNIGIDHARRVDATHILLLDQDSVVTGNMVSTLHEGMRFLKKNGVMKIGAIGPIYIDSKTGHQSHHRRFGLFGISKYKCCRDDEIVRVDYLIASGSLIEISTIDVVGRMEESFFIDHIDTEWVLRAASYGYFSWGHCGAKMHHSMGDSVTRVWFLRWRNIPTHQPSRYYYVFRNGVLLHLRPYVSRRWKWLDYVRMVQYILFIITLHDRKYASLKCAVVGVIDGLKKKTGKL